MYSAPYVYTGIRIENVNGSRTVVTDGRARCEYLQVQCVRCVKVCQINELVSGTQTRVATALVREQEYQDVRVRIVKTVVYGVCETKEKKQERPV